MWTETRSGRDYVIVWVSIQRTALRGGKRRDRLAPPRLGRRSFAAALGLRPPAGRSLHPARRPREPERRSAIVGGGEEERDRAPGRREAAGESRRRRAAAANELSAPPARPSGAAPGGVRAVWRRRA